MAIERGEQPRIGENGRGLRQMETTEQINLYATHSNHRTNLL